MTEGTADAAVRKALETCTAQTGVTVDRQPVPYPELVQKVLLAASSNSLPDIIYIDNSDVAQLADGGYIAPLADVGITIEGFVPALAALGNYKGADYAVPSANNTIALYYNTDMFRPPGWSRRRPGTSSARRRRSSPRTRPTAWSSPASTTSRARSTPRPSSGRTAARSKSSTRRRSSARSPS